MLQEDVYDFQLKEAMDHEYGNNGKNDFDLSFKFSVTSNGMTSDNKTFNVTVVDSVPNAGKIKMGNGILNCVKRF